MSDEVEHLDSELSESLTKIRADIEKLDWDTKQAGAPALQKKEEILRIKMEIDKARGVLQNYKVELRELDREDLAVYQPKTRQHQSALDELTRNLNFVKSSVEKEELMSGGSLKASESDGKSAQELIEMAKKTQGEDKEGVTRMQRMVMQSEEVGVATNIKLKTQTEQLKNISVDVSTVQARMKDANKLLNQIGRRMATDKFLAFVVVAMLIIIFAILVSRALGLDKPNADGVVYVGGEYLVVDCAIMTGHSACKNANTAQKTRRQSSPSMMLRPPQRAQRRVQQHFATPSAAQLSHDETMMSHDELSDDELWASRR
eukprot:CAMPEP_0179460010 /NCGR_PEP_ID=MMETSP0799-20121207/43189_1 /TAXON_ID=46947 /ORGANISM="Geminigera cryophila, Strain CCMP2564" /LENGTH=316 /DNA_ID=CAMNT_0021262091 /DNA_START=71 /DNA_END=1021 /DNA_ORIENTATION=+